MKSESLLKSHYDIIIHDLLGYVAHISRYEEVVNSKLNLSERFT